MIFSMTQYLFGLLWDSAAKFLVLPLSFCDALVTDLRLEWTKYGVALVAGHPPTLEQMVPFFKWLSLLIVIVVLTLLLVIVTIKGILFDDLLKKKLGRVVSDLVVLLLVLFLYYFIAASIVYFFFNLVLGAPL